MQRNVVVLPQPLGPSSVKNSDSLICRSMPSTATCSPKRFTRPWTEIIGRARDSAPAGWAAGRSEGSRCSGVLITWLDAPGAVNGYLMTWNARRGRRPYAARDATDPCRELRGQDLADDVTGLVDQLRILGR